MWYIDIGGRTNEITNQKSEKRKHTMKKSTLRFVNTQQVKELARSAETEYILAFEGKKKLPYIPNYLIPEVGKIGYPISKIGKIVQRIDLESEQILIGDNWHLLNECMGREWTREDAQTFYALNATATKEYNDERKAYDSKIR